MKNNVKESIADLKNWIVHSGIQNINKKSNINGAFSAWFDNSKKKYGFLYSEITGYGITTCLFLHKHFQEDVLIERAKLAAEWIIHESMHGLGGVKTRYYFEEEEENQNRLFDNRTICSFDTGMVIYGMINLHKKTGEKLFLDASVKMADFLIDTMLKLDGSFYAYLNLMNGSFVDDGTKWSTQSGSFHSKLAMGYIDLYEITKNDKYKKVAINVCDYALKQQTEEGRFISFSDSKNTHMHPHSYSAEGLLYVGIKLKISEYVESTKKAVEWALDNQLKEGGVPPIYISENNIFLKNERTDTLSQILRLSILLISYDKLDKRYVDRIHKLKDRILTFQEREGSQKGGMFYGNEEDGTRLNHINSWCSMFAVQALLLYQKYVIEKKDVSVDLLI